MRPLLALALAAGLVTTMPATAAASTFDASGWWWRAQTGLLVDVPAPPDVPEDGLAVGRAPDGPSEIAAVRYRLDEDEREPVLTLRVAEEQGGEAAGITACATRDHWNPSHGGRWEDRPGCEDGATTVAGVRGDDGSWTFELAPLATDEGILSLVLAPAEGTVPFRVTFEQPTDADLRTTRGGGDEAFVAPPVEAFVPGEGAPPPPVGTTDPAEQGAPPPIVAEPPPAAAAPPPQAAPPLQQAPQALAAPAASGLDPTLLAFVLLGVLAVVAADLWRQDAPAPRKLGRFAGDVPAEATRGLGRFARPRSGTPRPLV